MTQADKILQKMLITEKATELSSNHNQYTFRVHPDSNRISISEAVQKTFGVTVTNVNIINVKPKAKRDRYRRGKMGFKPGVKKALVTLKEGDHIDVL